MSKGVLPAADLRLVCRGSGRCVHAGGLLAQPPPQSDRRFATRRRSAGLPQRHDEIRSLAGFAGSNTLVGNDDRSAGRNRLGNSSMASAGRVRRSSASWGLSGPAAALPRPGLPRDLPLAQAALTFAAAIDVSGWCRQRDYRQVQDVAIVLVDLGGKNMFQAAGRLAR